VILVKIVNRNVIFCERYLSQKNHKIFLPKTKGMFAKYPSRYIHVLLTAILLCYAATAIAQHQVEYAYDAAGNRIGRVATTLRLAVTPPTRVSQQPVDTVPPSVVPVGELSVKIWPNPTKGIIRLQVSGRRDDSSVGLRLYSSSGVLLKESEETTDIIEMDLGGFSAATYLLRFSCQGETRVVKIIKE